MPTLIAKLIAWLVRKLGLLLLILAVLLIGAWLRNEWQELRKLDQEIEQQEKLTAGLRTELDEKDAAIAADASQWRQQTVMAARALMSELETLDEQIANAELQWRGKLDEFADLERQADAAAAAATRARREVASREAAFWPWERLTSPVEYAELEAARVKHAVLEKTAQGWSAARDRMKPVVAKSPIASMQKRRALLTREIDDRQKSPSPRQAQLAADRERKHDQILAAEAQLAAQRQKAEQDPRSTLFRSIRENLPIALAVLAGILLLPVLMRALFYFVLAPLASRLPPIRILPNDRAPPIAPLLPSGVSAAIDIHPGEELLVQPGFLQSSSQPARKRARSTCPA